MKVVYNAHMTRLQTTMICGLLACFVTASTSFAANSEQLTNVAQARLAKNADDQLGRDILSLALTIAPSPATQALKDALLDDKAIAPPTASVVSNVAAAARLAEEGEKLISSKQTRQRGLLLLAASKRLDPLQEKSHILLLKAKQYKLETDFHKLIVAVAGKPPLEKKEAAPNEARQTDRPNIQLAQIEIPESVYYYRANSHAQRLTAIQNAGKNLNFRVMLDEKADLPITNKKHGGFRDKERRPTKADEKYHSLRGSLESIVHRFCKDTKSNYYISGNLITFTAIDNPKAINDHGFLISPKNLKQEFAANQSKATMRYRGKTVLISGKVTASKKLAGGKSAITLDDAVDIHLDRDMADQAEKIRLLLIKVQQRQDPKNYNMSVWESKMAWKRAISQNIQVSAKVKCWGSKFGQVVLINPDPFDWDYRR